MRSTILIFLSLGMLLTQPPIICAQETSEEAILTQAFAEAVEAKKTELISVAKDKMEKNPTAVAYLKKHHPDLYLFYKSLKLADRTKNLGPGLPEGSVASPVSVTELEPLPKDIEGGRRTNQDSTKRSPNQERPTNRRIAIDSPNQDRRSNQSIVEDFPNQDRPSNQDRIRARKR